MIPAGARTIRPMAFPANPMMPNQNIVEPAMWGSMAGGFPR